MTNLLLALAWWLAGLMTLYFNHERPHVLFLFASSVAALCCALLLVRVFVERDKDT